MQHDDHGDHHDAGRTGDDSAHPGDDGGGGFAAAVSAAPGPGLAAWLCALDVDGLSAHELVLVIQAWERVKAHAEAVQTRALAALCEREEYARCSCPIDVVHEHRPVEPAGDEVSLALAWTPGRAKNRLSVAVELCEDLPDTLAALEAGRIDADKARLLADRTRCLSTLQARRQVEAAVLPLAHRLTRAQLDRALRREVIAADPAAAEQRRRNAADGRRVTAPETASPGAEDAMAVVNLYGPAEDLAALYTAIDAAARHARDNGDPRTLNQLRFDTLTNTGWNALDLAHLGCCNPTCTGDNDTTNADAGTSTSTNAASRAAGAEAGAGRDTTSAEAGGPFHRSDTTTSGPPANTAREHPDRDQPDQPDGEQPGRDQPGPDQPDGEHPDHPGGEGQGRTGRRARRGGPVRLGRHHRRAAAVNVTVAASTLFGADEQPAWLDGFGPITPDTARRISTEGPWRRLLTDPATHELLEYGRTTYHPPQALTDYVTARDRTCRLPTCDRPATTDADIDHKHPYNQGGTTGATNTWALHDGHHLGKTHHNYRIHTDTHGTTWWTTPTGHHYQVHPETIGPLTSRRPTPHADETPPF